MSVHREYIIYTSLSKHIYTYWYLDGLTVKLDFEKKLKTLPQLYCGRQKDYTRNPHVSAFNCYSSHFVEV